MEIQKQYRIGYALSGGGARGVAHLGVLKALEEMGIMPNVISGTSAGAIIGAFYAQGYGIEEIVDFIGRIKFFSLPQLLWRKSGFFDMRSFEQLYTELIPHHSFEGLKMPVHIATTDIVRGEVVYFNTGNLIKPLLATSCIPLIYQPIEYDGKMLVDGGVLNNFPIEPLENQCEYIIGVHVNSLSKKVEQLHFKDMLDRSFHFALSNAVYSKSSRCNLFIDPPDMSRYGMFDLKKSKHIYAAAYHHTHDMEKQIMNFRKIALGF